MNLLGCIFDGDAADIVEIIGDYLEKSNEISVKKTHNKEIR
jgi:hypothetical protein